MPRVTTDINAKPRLFFTVTIFMWFDLLSHFGSISFGCTRPQAKDQVVFFSERIIGKCVRIIFGYNSSGSAALKRIGADNK
jgi:hypothetical protein